MPALITCDQDFGLVVVVFLRRQISGDKIALLCQEHLITTRTDQNGQIFCENPILLEEEMENPIQIQAHHVGWVCLYTDYGGNTKLGMIDQNSGQIIRTVEPTVDEPYKSVIGLGAWGGLACLEEYNFRDKVLKVQHFVQNVTDGEMSSVHERCHNQRYHNQWLEIGSGTMGQTIRSYKFLSQLWVMETGKIMAFRVVTKYDRCGYFLQALAIVFSPKNTGLGYYDLNFVSEQEVPAGFTDFTLLGINGYYALISCTNIEREQMKIISLPLYLNLLLQIKKDAETGHYSKIGFYPGRIRTVRF